MSRIHPARWQTVVQLVDQYCESGQVPAIALRVITSETTCHYRQGRQSVRDDNGTLRDDAIFLVASITKPIVVLGVLKLLEQGELLLNDRVKQYIPEFGCAGKHGITIRHLMTHTSGLPDMLPNNRELRAAQAPLSEFVSQICELTPDEPPGRIVQYQSTGIAILGELIQRITGKSAPQYLRDELFQPLEMHDTSLGVPPAWSEGDAARLERIVEIHVPPELNVEPHWDWNSPYWRGFGAPWGGLFTTPTDLGKLVNMLQQQGLALDQRLFSAQTIRQATRDQLPEIPGLSETARQGKGWGLGWQIVTRAKSDYYGDLLSDQAYGHGGATGTVLWIDPQLATAAIILTTEPQEPHGRYLARLTNAIVAAIEV